MNYLMLACKEFQGHEDGMIRAAHSDVEGATCSQAGVSVGWLPRILVPRTRELCAVSRRDVIILRRHRDRPPAFLMKIWGAVCALRVQVSRRFGVHGAGQYRFDH